MLIRLSTLVALLALAVGIGAHKQVTFKDDNQFHNETISNVLPVVLENLASVTSEDSFTTLSHARFPHHAVRIKKSQFCDPTVSVYTGYLDVDKGAKHLFFYFFESRRNPETDDVMMWINGGMGYSRPCSIDPSGSSPNGTTWNPYSWNKEANIFFLDQPVGVGYSYADFGETVETTEDAAKNVHAFITIFYEVFKQFEGRALHLAGESYGGRYLPVFASEIYDQNQIAKAEGRPTINLQSILIGNGITDISTLYQGRYEIECGTAALEIPFQQISSCVRMKSALPRCEALMRDGCIDQFDHMNCGAATCEDQDLCYAEDAIIEDFLDAPETRKMLGAESPGKFSICSGIVGRNFFSHLDKWAHHTQDYVTALLERDIRMLIYAGTYDWQCNWMANKLWVDKLDWKERSAYAKESWRSWYVNGEKAGETKNAGPLTFATVLGAGHMMKAQALVSRWLANQAI
ncbi:Alpha/Beta hydrolase protein [Suillus ampliporus]|nr:Alpha/Beta hydrolase protein [Suillus ampliporus]